MKRSLTRSARRATALSVIGLSLAATPGLATDGSLYPLGVPNAGSAAPWSVSRNGNEFFSTAAAGSATAGPKVWWDWNDCGRGGSYIERVSWAGQRTGASTSARLAYRLNGVDLVNLVNLPVGSWGYYAGGTGGNCAAQLRIEQVGGGTEPIRSYWTSWPEAYARDVTAPSAGLHGVDGSWRRGGAVGISWAASDNFGSDGIGQQRVYVGPRLVYAGNPGQSGGHSISADLGGLGSGEYNVELQVDGDGTAGAASGGQTVRIDLTPPALSLSASVPSSGKATVPMSVSDAHSGLASWRAYVVHAAGETEIANHGTGWNPNLDLGAYNGQDVKIRVVATDNVGNSTSSLTQALRVDTTAPNVAISGVPAGWITKAEGATAVASTLSDNRADGVGHTTMSVFKDIDSAAGATVDVAAWNTSGKPSLSQGSHALSFPLDGFGLADGVHVIRLTARDPQFPTLAGSATAKIKVDTTKPDAGAPAGFTVKRFAGEPSKAEITPVGASDATSGLARVEIEVNSALGGAETGAWTKIGANAAPQDGLATTVNLAGLGEGVHAYRVRVYDAAGNDNSKNMPIATLQTDLTVPEIPTVVIDDGLVKWKQTDGGSGFGLCPTTIEIMGAGTDGQWVKVQEVAGAALPGGEGSFPLPIKGMPNGTYQVRVTVCDASGNTVSKTTSFEWAGTPGAPGGPGSGGSGSGGNGAPGSGNTGQPAGVSPIAGVQIDKLTSPQAGFFRRIDGRIVPVIRVRYGAKIKLAGRFVHQDGAPLANTTVVVKDSANCWRAGSRTDANGRFAVFTKAIRGGRWAVAATQDGFEERTPFELRVAPIVRLGKRTLTVSRGEALVVRGALIPAAEAYGKRIQLQWKDGGRWRPVADGRVARSGRFIFRYHFEKAGGYGVTMRVAAPQERGWAFAPVSSTPFKVTVR